ncbi:MULTISPECIES: hypothetical protein [unclassified Okeania]|nr:MULTISPECIES: hypothetical protein [unclassified Okeania]
MNTNNICEGQWVIGNWHASQTASNFGIAANVTIISRATNY